MCAFQNWRVLTVTFWKKKYVLQIYIEFLSRISRKEKNNNKKPTWKHNLEMDIERSKKKIIKKLDIKYIFTAVELTIMLIIPV